MFSQKEEMKAVSLAIRGVAKRLPGGGGKNHRRAKGRGPDGRYFSLAPRFLQITNLLDGLIRLFLESYRKVDPPQSPERVKLLGAEVPRPFIEQHGVLRLIVFL